MGYLLQIRRYSLPLRTVVRTAHGVMTQREGVILRLEDEAGRAGFGEAGPVPGFGSGTVEKVVVGLRELGSSDGTTGTQRVGTEELKAGVVRGGCVGFALESALEDIRRLVVPVGQVADLAVSNGAGKNRSQLDELAYSRPDFLPVAALLPVGKGAVGQIGPLGEEGFRTFKWKVGVAPVREELPLLDEVCAELPGGAKLRLDANGAWDRRTAERWLERCAERPVEFVEQPCFAAASQGTALQRRTEDLLRGLAEDYPTVIALDESLSGEGDVERWLAAGWRGVWVIKPSLTGGAETLARLRRANADVVFSSALETAVGARAALRAAFAWGENQRALGFGVWPLFEDGRFDGPHRAPFLWAPEVERINVEAAWSALS